MTVGAHERPIVAANVNRDRSQTGASKDDLHDQIVHTPLMAKDAPEMAAADII
jgi:hypothetical protein